MVQSRRSTDRFLKKYHVIVPEFILTLFSLFRSFFAFSFLLSFLNFSLFLQNFLPRVFLISFLPSYLFTLYFFFLFRRVPMQAKSAYCLRPVRFPVCLSVRLWAYFSSTATRWISVTLIMGTFTKFYSEDPNLFKIRQKYRALCTKTYVSFVVDGDFKSPLKCCVIKKRCQAVVVAEGV